MRKEIFSKGVKRVFAIALAATLAAPTVLSVNVTKADAAEVAVPTPIKAYNFENGLDGVDGAEIVNSETIYVVKTADKLAEGEKLDANGLVYTGEGKDARYVTVDPIGTPTVKSVADRGGSVLEFDDTTARIDEYRKDASSKTDDMSDDTARALDFQVPVHDLFYVEADSVAGVTPIKTQNVSAEVKIDNPFAGLADELKEYEETEDVDARNYEGKYVPRWKKGVTVSYWVKVPVGEDGAYQNSSVLRWENDNEYYIQADDYSKFLPIKLFEQQYSKLDEQYKKDAFKFSPSGVYMYNDPNEVLNNPKLQFDDPDGLLDFYFDYEPDYTTVDGEGNLVPIEYVGESGKAGPVYDFTLIQKMQAKLRGKTQFTGSARFYFANPNYKNGYYKMTDGSIVAMDGTATPTYSAYKELPYVSDHEGNKVKDFTTSYIKLDDDSQKMNEGKSNLRYALEDGEFQIDADNSVFWVPDNNLGINENKNVQASYLNKAGMQNGNVFFMNSWRESSGTTIWGDGSYQSAEYVALSPVSKRYTIDEDGDGEPDLDEDDEIIYVEEPNGNAGEWHHVVATIMNDWVEFYVDGECVDVENTYSSRGATTLDTKKSFKRFNKGAGMRNGAGSEKNMGNIAYGNYVCRVLMDWISDENSKLCLGGIGNYANEYAQATTTSKVCLDNLKFYSTVLNENQVKALYANDSVGEGGIPGDVDGSGEVTLDDVLLSLKFALKVEEPTAAEAAADVDGKDGVTLDDVLIILKKALKVEG